VSIYRHPGAAIVRCLRCDHEQRIEWEVGDPPIFMPAHCDTVMVQITHNDGETPVDQPCPAGCCRPGQIGRMPTKADLELRKD
jgi:hypothetical protein